VTVRSDGHYDKFAFSAARLQHVSERLSLYAAIKGQFASQNLDTSEKIGLGGVSDVSAYPSGEAYGDEGYVLKVEARTPLPSLSMHLPGQLQLIGFADTGRVTLNKRPWSEGANHRTLHSIGIGLNWTQYDDFAVSATLARRLGSEQASSAPDKTSRFWLQAVKYF
jgi:hemolysin activation/secretion protein